MIPYRNQRLLDQVRNYGIDYATLQPNYHIYPKANYANFAEVHTSLLAGYVDGIHFEIPFSDNPVRCCNEDWRINLRTYFSQAYYYGWNRNRLNTYYHGSVISQLGRIADADYRMAYERIYQYIVSTRDPLLGAGNSLNTVSRYVIDAASMTAVFVLPDYGGHRHTPSSKCANVGAASIDDYSSAGPLLTVALNMQNQILDTDPSISQDECGNPSGVGNVTIAAIGGPWINTVTYYYEQIAGISPVYSESDGSDIVVVVRTTGETYTITPNMDGSTDSGPERFLLQSFLDGQGRHVYLIYGSGWAATLAAVLFLRSFVLSSLFEFTNSWYVYEWTDSTALGVTGTPDAGDAFNVVATG
jgi:hypothetical protein